VRRRSPRPPQRREAQEDAEHGKGKRGDEPVFGQIKEARGFRRFRLRGASSVRSVRAEFALIPLTHDLLKLFRTVTSLAMA
jgi:hypothetical protein